MNTKSLAAAALAVALVLPVSACSSSKGSGASSSGTSSKTIVLIAKGNDDHWTQVGKGAQAAAKELGYTVQYNQPDTENEGDKQVNMMNSAINNHPAGIGIAPQDGAQEALPGLLKDLKVPVVAFDTPIKGSDVPVATIASDNYGMGAKLPQNLSTEIGGTGKVAMVTNGLLGTAAERRNGFTDWMKKNAPGITVVSVQNGEADPAKARDKAQAILQANPDLKGLAGTSEYSVIAIADEVAAKHLSTKVVGIDAGPDVLTLLKQDKIDGIVTQNPCQIGYQTVETLVKAAKGEKLASKQITTDSLWVTKAKLDDPEVKKVLGI